MVKVKRSSQIRLCLLGGLIAGSGSGCTPRAGAAANAGEETRISAESYDPNDHYVAGAGYYHAPFRAFFPYRYNHYDAQRREYFFGGQWAAQPCQSVVNLSAPTPEAAAAAEAARPVITRHGFGGTGGSHHIWS